MSLGSTQPVTEMSVRNISWGKGGRFIWLTTLLPSCAECLEIWEPQPSGTLGACQGLYGDFFTLFCQLKLCLHCALQNVKNLQQCSFH